MLDGAGSETRLPGGREDWAAIKDCQMRVWANRYRVWRNNQPRNINGKNIEQFFGLVIGSLGGGYVIFHAMLGAMYFAIDNRVTRFNEFAFAASAMIGLLTILFIALRAEAARLLFSLQSRIGRRHYIRFWTHGLGGPV
jgi:hypothetical protein